MVGGYIGTLQSLAISCLRLSIVEFLRSIMSCHVEEIIIHLNFSIGYQIISFYDGILMSNYHDLGFTFTHDNEKGF